MNAAIGIDFGTTNSTICLFDGADYHYVDLESGNLTIPSLMYVDKQLYPRYGEMARSHFLRDNLNRQIKLEKTDLGYIEIALGDNAYGSFDHTGFAPGATTYDAKVTALTDQNLPGFLFASTKRLLGNATIRSVKVFNKNIKIEAVVSSIIRNIFEKSRFGYPELIASKICVGRPVNYECGAASTQINCNALAIERMDRALDFANVSDHSYFLEPIAPVLSHIHENDEERNQDILVLDYGGGTLDFSLIKKRENRLRVVGNFGRPLGGDIITEQLIRDHVFPKLGITDANLLYLKKHDNYLEEIVPDLLNWRTTYILNQPKHFMQLANAIKILPDEAINLNRIRLLVIQNFSYNVFFAIENAKKRLSNEPETEVVLDPIGLRFTLTRPDLENSMRNYLSSVESSIETFCGDTGYNPSQIGRVLLTGGTSLIPCIQKQIADIFPGKVVNIDPFLSIVKGFALGALLKDQGNVSGDEDHMQIDLI